VGIIVESKEIYNMVYAYGKAPEISHLTVYERVAKALSLEHKCKVNTETVKAIYHGSIGLKLLNHDIYQAKKEKK